MTWIISLLIQYCLGLLTTLILALFSMIGWKWFAVLSAPVVIGVVLGLILLIRDLRSRSTIDASLYLPDKRLGDWSINSKYYDFAVPVDPDLSYLRGKMFPGEEDSVEE